MTDQSNLKIVIVSGQEFTAPADLDNEALRQQLASLFPEVAAAKIKIGTKTVNDTSMPTVEFVKQAGTKGLDSVTAATIAARLRAVRPTTVDLRPVDRRIARLVDGLLTVDQALADETLPIALDAQVAAQSLFEVSSLCQRICALPAVADDVPCGW